MLPYGYSLGAAALAQGSRIGRTLAVVALALATAVPAIAGERRPADIVDARTVTRSRPVASASASLSRIASRCGATRGACMITTASTLTIAHPSAASVRHTSASSSSR